MVLIHGQPFSRFILTENDRLYKNISLVSSLARSIHHAATLNPRNLASSIEGTIGSAMNTLKGKQTSSVFMISGPELVGSRIFSNIWLTASLDVLLISGAISRHVAVSISRCHSFSFCFCFCASSSFAFSGARKTDQKYVMLFCFLFGSSNWNRDFRSKFLCRQSLFERLKTHSHIVHVYCSNYDDEYFILIPIPISIPILILVLVLILILEVFFEGSTNRQSSLNDLVAYYCHFLTSDLPLRLKLRDDDSWTFFLV